MGWQQYPPYMMQPQMPPQLMNHGNGGGGGGGGVRRGRVRFCRLSNIDNEMNAVC